MSDDVATLRMAHCQRAAAWVFVPPNKDFLRQRFELRIPRWPDDLPSRDTHAVLAVISERNDGRWQWSRKHPDGAVRAVWEFGDPNQGTETTLGKAQEEAEAGWRHPGGGLRPIVRAVGERFEYLWRPGDLPFHPPKTVVSFDPAVGESETVTVDIDGHDPVTGYPVIRVIRRGDPNPQTVPMPKDVKPYDALLELGRRRWGFMSRSFFSGPHPHLGVNMPAGAAVAVSMAQAAELAHYMANAEPVRFTPGWAESRPPLDELYGMKQYGTVPSKLWLDETPATEPIRNPPVAAWAVLTKAEPEKPAESLQGTPYTWLENLVRQHLDVTQPPGSVLVDHLRRELMARAGKLKGSHDA